MTAVKIKREKVSEKELLAFGTASFRNNFASVGIVDASTSYDDGTAVIDVAVWNEFGTGRIPERPALRNALQEAVPELQKLGQRQGALILDGRLTIRQAVENYAQLMVKAMQFHILALKEPANAPSTIKQKGFDDPLIETGLYHDSINYKISNKVDQ